MTIKTRKGFNIQPVLDLLSQSGNESDDPPRGFGLLFSREKAYLRTAIDAKDLSDFELSRVIEKALREAPKLTQESFLKHCNLSASQIDNEKHDDFKVVFPLWGAQHLISGRRKWDKVWIAFDVDKSSAFARKALADRITQLKTRGKNVPTVIEQVEELPWAVCSIRSINMVDAFERAEYAITKELGLYSIVTSRKKEQLSSLAERPINTMLLAPHMTVHNPSGTISNNIFWYNRWDLYLNQPGRTQDEITRIRGKVDRLRRKIRRLPWRDKAEQVLIRYYNAFAHFDLEKSFLDGWKLLEFIGGDEGTKGDTLIKRAAFLTSDPTLSKEIGMHLRHRRNLISHGRSINDASNETLAFQMKSFVRPLLETFLTNPFSFQKEKDLWDFCDLPVDKTERDKQAKLLATAQKFRDQ
jgi:hypothetical protein